MTAVVYERGHKKARQFDAKVDLFNNQAESCVIITKNGRFGLLNEREKKNRGQQITVIWLFGRARVSGGAGAGYCQQTDAGADGGIGESRLFILEANCTRR